MGQNKTATDMFLGFHPASCYPIKLASRVLDVHFKTDFLYRIYNVNLKSVLKFHKVTTKKLGAKYCSLPKKTAPSSKLLSLKIG